MSKKYLSAINICRAFPVAVAFFCYSLPKTGLALTVQQLSGSVSNGIIEVSGLSAGQFNPGFWVSNTLNWVADVRSPMVSPLAGANRNIYAPSVVLEPSGWRLFYGGWDGTSTGNDRIWSYNSSDFVTYNNHALVIDNGALQHVCNVNVHRIEDGSYQMLCTALPYGNPPRNRPAYFSSPDGIVWNGTAQPYAAQLSDLVTNVAGYANYATGDFNGGNVLLRDNGGYLLYLFDFSNLWTVAVASGTNPKACTNIGSALSSSGVPNDVKKFTIGGTNWYVMGMHVNGSTLYYALSNDGTNFSAMKTLFTNKYGANDQYITSIGFACQGSNVLGVVYGSGASSSLTENRLFGCWLQKRIVLTDTNGVEAALLGGLGPDRQRFQTASTSTQWTLTAYAEDGVTPMESAQVAMTTGGIYHVVFANTPPPAPADVMATPGNRRIDLSWTPSPGATSYNVASSPVSGGPYTGIAVVGSTNYTCNNLINGTKYYFVVSASNANGEGSCSWEVSATPATNITYPAPSWSTAVWTNDATSGISSNSTYTHAYNLGSAVNPVISGVAFTGVAGGNPTVSGKFSLNIPNALPNGGVGHNNFPNPSGSYSLVNDFVFNNLDPTLTLQGLTAGTRYLLTIFGFGYEAQGSGRSAVFTAQGVSSANIDEDASGNGNGIRVELTYVATNSTQVISWHSSGSASWHLPGFANAVVPFTATHEVPYSWLAGINPAWSNNYEAAALDDPDGDGYPTWQEHWCGTDPVNSNSFLKIDAITFAGTNMVLEWQHARVDTGIPAIIIEASTNLSSGSWTNAGQKIAVNGINTWLDGARQQTFYRLAVTNLP